MSLAIVSMDSKKGLCGIMAEELKVYLDHHISRDDFLYKHSHEKVPRDVSQYSSVLRLKDLYGEKSMNNVLCKPDFQRVTWAWTPRECVSLLDSVVNEQIIPSIIMWLSPEGRWYVLDGGHRISAVLAWLEDDWGDHYAEKYIVDQELAKKIQDAAHEMRFLMKTMRIGSFKDYQASYEKDESVKYFV